MERKIMSDRRHPRSLEDLPEAKIKKNWKTYFIWLVPIGAAALAAWFIYSDMVKRGPTLHIFFDSSAGLEAGKSPLKYRGAQIGEVKTITLTKDHQHVKVTVSLEPSAESIAREGSRFWIVKAEFGAEQIRGLRTIVSGDYITVEPGAGKPQTNFKGLSEAPVVEAKDVLRIVLLTEQIGSLKQRAPVFYRGVEVGQVFSTDLGHMSQTIQVVVDIQRHYAPLVRMNSKFWNAGGINVNLSLSGLNIAAQSAETLVSGGIAFATPDASDKEAASGTAFRLYDKPDNAWLSWAPAIDLKDTDTNSPEKIDLSQ
jgi:paraquat-inducible protein B